MVADPGNRGGLRSWREVFTISAPTARPPSALRASAGDRQPARSAGSHRWSASGSRCPGNMPAGFRTQDRKYLSGRFNASSTIPVHGAGPWVIVETPTRHHPRRRGRPIPRRLLLGWSERVRIRQRLRAHICAGSGRTPGATPKCNVDTTQGLDAGFRKPASFFVRLRLPRGRSPAGAVAASTALSAASRA